MTAHPTQRLRGEARQQAADKLAQRYDAGEPLRVLAESFGRSYGFVRALALEGGATMRGRGGARAKRTP